MKKLMTIALIAAATMMTQPGMGKDNSDDAKAGAQVPGQYRFSTNVSATVNYLIYLPQDYTGKRPGAKTQDAGKSWPMILFLHGAGERGTNIWRVAIHGPPSLVTNKTEFPFIVVSPQCPEGQKWSRETLLGLLQEVKSSYSVDPERVYLTGLSMGGYGTWDLGLSNPDKFAAIVPICGGGEMITVLLSRYDAKKTAALRSLGIWAFHGAKDPVVPLSESERMVDAAKRVGVKEVKFTVYPEADHNSWTETYKNPEVYKWLLEHRRRAQ